MDQFAHLLVRMALWLRRPPSRQWLWIAAIVVIAAAILVGLEYAGLWPESWKVQRLPRNPLPPNP
ncbi:hypothetical protein [Ensifer soli]|uniref:hypothetical protein n=1 Tax=Ciceribacter sp. sgz301302 TaxID=3342379 RepID=UPI0035BAFBA2